MARKSNGCGGSYMQVLLLALDVKNNPWLNTKEMYDLACSILKTYDMNGYSRKVMDARIREAAGCCGGGSHKWDKPLFEVNNTVRPQQFRLNEDGVTLATELQNSIADQEESRLVRQVKTSNDKSYTKEVAVLKTLQWFMENRRQQYDAALQIVGLATSRNHLQQLINRFICLWGPLKWGKREVLDCLALMLKGDIKLYYVLSLNRKDMKEQKAELASYGWNIVEYKNIKIDKSDHSPYIIAFDECDYGDGNDQCFDRWYTTISDRENIVLMGISATPFTFIYSMDERFQEAPIVIGKVAESFVGLGRFQVIVKNDGAILPDGTFTDSFKQVITEWAKTDNVKKMKFIVRQTRLTNDSSIKNNIEQQLGNIWFSERGNRKVSIKFVDMNMDEEKFWKRNNDDSWENDGNQLIIVKQTFTRGTETDIHPFLYGYYDCRNESTPANTILQALGRFSNYKGVDDIKIYIGQDHKIWLDAYIDMERGIAEGKKFSHYTEKYQDIPWTGKLKPNKKQQAARNREWQYDWTPLDSKNEAENYLNSKKNEPDFIDWRIEKWDVSEKESLRLGVCTVSENNGDDSDIIARMMSGGLGHAGDGRLIHHVNEPSVRYRNSWNEMISNTKFSKWAGKYVVAFPRRSSNVDKSKIIPLVNKSMFRKHMSIIDLDVL